MRFLAILVSYLVSALAATGAALLLLTAKSVVEGRSSTLGQALLDVSQIGGPALLIVAVTAAIPFVCCIVLLHVLRQKSPLAHGVAGALVSLVALFVLSGGPLHPSVLGESWYIPVAGGLGGLAYWLCRYQVLRYMGADEI